MPATRLTVSDIVIAAAIIIAAALLFCLGLTGVDGQYAEITTRDGFYGRYRLDSDGSVNLSSGGHTLTVVIEDGCAYVAESDCDDGICVATGSIRRSGEVIICAPAGVAVRITGGDADADGIAG